MSDPSTPAPTAGPASAPPARPAPSAPPAQTPAQVPGAAAGSTSGPLASPPAPAPVAAGDPSGLAAKLEGELAQLRADAIAGEKAILRVLAPHSSMTFGGITVTGEPTPVPAHAVSGLQEAALNAGVELVQEH